MLCLACGERPVHARGRCNRCYEYLRTTGAERPSGGPILARGAQAAGWKGDAAKEDSKRNRAQRSYALTECERCGRPGEVRHHKDENPGNNDPQNIEILCRRCHQQHHMGLPPRPCQHCGRLSKKLKRGRCNVCYQYLRINGRDRPADLLARTATRRATLPSGDLEVAAPDGSAAIANELR